MDLTWIKDYGAVVAALAAVVATVINAYLQHRRDRRFKTGEWLRQMRMPRYVAFVRASDEYESAIFYAFANHEPEMHGPMPVVVPELHSSNAEFRHRLAEVTLVGPPDVAVAAKKVSYSLIHYYSRLEYNPDDWGQNVASQMLDDFIAVARKVLEAEGMPMPVPSYEEWRKSLPKDD